MDGNVNKYSSIPETQKHIDLVREYMMAAVDILVKKAFDHDRTKMMAPEVETFDEYTPKLRGMTYGSDEYKQCLDGMRPALEHHYKMNSHHPEHFEQGIKGMNLLELLEMFCDWCAASKRHGDGDIFRSININAERFGYDDTLRSIFEQTALTLGEK